MINLTDIVQALLALIAVLITVYVIPWLKSKLTKEQLESLIYWTSIAVDAAEQVYSDNDHRKAYVISFLESKGYTIDTEDIYNEIEALIEAAVYELNYNQTAGLTATLESSDKPVGEESAEDETNKD